MEMRVGTHVTASFLTGTKLCVTIFCYITFCYYYSLSRSPWRCDLVMHTNRISAVGESVKDLGLFALVFTTY